MARHGLGWSDLGLAVGAGLVCLGVALLFGYAWSLVLLGLALIAGSYLAGRA